MLPCESAADRFQIQSLRVPKFLKFVPTEYDAATFEPSEFDVANARDAAPKPTIRFRRDATTGQMKSNTMVYRWSDGSTTMSVGGEQYQLTSKSFAPPQDRTYHEMTDAHYYAAAAHLKSNLLVVVGHISEQYTVKPPKDVKDDAVIRLSERLAAATRGAHGDGDMIIKTTQDPELQKKQAEQAEKERNKAQRRRETAAARVDGVGRYKSGGLSIGDLEGGRRAAGAGRKRGAPGAAKPKRHKPGYDSDDDLPQGARYQDDYDLEDDFIAASDDEEAESGEGDDEEEEELLDDEDEDEAPRSKRQKTADAEDADADAEADLDDDVPAPAAESTRRGRRNVIEDDDE